MHQHQKDGFIICRDQERREGELNTEAGQLELKVQCGVQFQRLPTNERKKVWTVVVSTKMFSFYQYINLLINLLSLNKSHALRIKTEDKYQIKN